MIANQGYNVGVAITKSDTVDMVHPSGKTLTDAIYVGGTGTIIGVQQDGTTVGIAGAVVGSILPLRLKRVNSGSTTATNLVALYQV